MQDIIQTLHSLLKYIPHIFTILCPAILLLFLVIGRFDIFVNSSLVLIPLTLTSLFLIITKNKKANLLSETGWPVNISQKSLLKVYLIAAIFAAVWQLLGLEGPVLLILFAVAYLAIILQMVSSNCPCKIVLLEICIITALLVLPKLCSPAFFYGDGDLFTHIRLAEGIAYLGQLLPSELGGAYTTFFIYHLSSAMTAITTGLAVNDALYVVSEITVIAAFPFVYLLARRFTGSERVAVFSVFFYSTANILTMEYLMPAPRVIASVAFIIILYLLFSQNIKKKYLFILSLLVMLYMVMTHHAQLPLALITMTVLCLGSLIYRRKLTIGNLNVMIVFLSCIIGYLIYNYLGSIIGIVKTRLFSQVEAGVALDSVATSGEALNISLQSLIIFLSASVMVIFVMIGLYMLITHIHRSDDLITLLPFTLLLFIAITPWVLDSIPFIYDSLQIYRFRLLFIPIFAVIMGFGCLSFLNIMQACKVKKWMGAAVVILLCLMLVVATPVMGMSRDNEAFSSVEWVTSYRVSHLNDADLEMFDFVGSHIEYRSSYLTDHFYARYYPTDAGYSFVGKPYYSVSRNLGLIFKNSGESLSQDYILFPKERYSNDVIGLRSYEGENTYVEGKAYTYSASYDNNNILNQVIYPQNKAYNSVFNEIYRTS